MRLLILFILVNFNLQAQNLVPNPSFEVIDSCYGAFSNLGDDVFIWSGCDFWSNPTRASADLWCQDGVAGFLEPPQTACYQNPRTGNNMAGIYIVESGNFNYREYIQIRLSSTLREGIWYNINFYVNTCNYNNPTSSIQAYISKTPLSYPTLVKNISLDPQIINDTLNLIRDTIGWTLISGYYKSIGDENYLTIGNFYDSLKTYMPFYQELTNDGAIYFFVDDVEVSEAKFELFIPNVFTPNCDNNNDVFSVYAKFFSDWKCNIYNRWGELIVELNEENKFWDGKENTDGTYYYVFKGRFNNKDIYEANFFHLIK